MGPGGCTVELHLFLPSAFVVVNQFSNEIANRLSLSNCWYCCCWVCWWRWAQKETRCLRFWEGNVVVPWRMKQEHFNKPNSYEGYGVSRELLKKRRGCGGFS
ncbi:hypothetical protein EV1_000489 [Malus domestica]